MQRQPNSAVNEVIASILIVVLVISLAVIIGGIVFGLIVIQPKSAYIPPEVKVVNNLEGKPQAISLYSRGGDMAVLDKNGGSNYALGIYIDTPSLSYTAIPDNGVRTFNPGQTLYIYWDDPDYRITENLSSITSILPNKQLTLRIVDENAKLLVYNQGMTISGGGTVVPTATCTPVGTGWVITNPNTIDIHYSLSYQPGNIVVKEGTIQASSKLIIWSPYYQETGGSPHRLRTLSGPNQGQTSAKTTSKLWCQFTDKYETYSSGSPGMLLLDPYE